jgi:hypothetical protein
VVVKNWVSEVELPATNLWTVLLIGISSSVITYLMEPFHRRGDIGGPNGKPNQMKDRVSISSQQCVTLKHGNEYKLAYL